MSLDLFKNVIHKMLTNHTYLIFIYEEDLSFNQIKWLIGPKTKPNRTTTATTTIIIIIIIIIITAKEIEI